MIKLVQFHFFFFFFHSSFCLCLTPVREKELSEKNGFLIITSVLLIAPCKETKPFIIN